ARRLSSYPVMVAAFRYGLSVQRGRARVASLASHGTALSSGWDATRDATGRKRGTQRTQTWSLSATSAALDEGQPGALGDLPGLLQDLPLLVGRVHQAVMDSLSERLDRGVWLGLPSSGSGAYEPPLDGAAGSCRLNQLGFAQRRQVAVRGRLRHADR